MGRGGGREGKEGGGMRQLCASATNDGWMECFFIAKQDT